MRIEGKYIVLEGIDHFWAAIILAITITLIISIIYPI